VKDGRLAIWLGRGQTVEEVKAKYAAAAAEEQVALKPAELANLEAMRWTRRH
jgi:hypothetical protein